MSHIKQFIFLLVCFYNFNPHFVSSVVTLSKDGGYHIVLAINENTQLIPRNPMLYMQNIQDNLQIFSHQLSLATHGKFYVKNVDVLIPWSWTVEIPSTPQGIQFATTQSYETADIRLFEDHQTPHVENPNPCGFTGNYIELPLSFFDNKVHPKYGITWKAFMNQWARYRWGVWEEHGTVENNTKFPYFYRKPNGTSWLVNGCSNVPIVGNVTNSLGEECELQSKHIPDSDCRLRPQDESNSAESSFMQFHWLDSIDSFCDAETHDSESPNRQNKYCGYRSIWEVLKGSNDYRIVTEEVSNVPNISFSITVKTRRPMLYLLIDEGRTNVPQYVIDQVYGNLTKLFDLDVEENNVASLGTYPSSFEYHQIVNEKVHWKLIRDYHEEFFSALEESFLTRAKPGYGPTTRNFGEAILHVVRDINERNSPSGTILLIIKTGAGENTFGKLTAEAEILEALDVNQNIIVHAVEMPNSVSKPYTNNLKRLVEKTGGQHAIISKAYQIIHQLIPMLNDINEYLARPMLFPQATRQRQETIYKGFVKPGQSISIPIYTQDLKSLSFHFTLSKSIDARQIKLISDKHPDGNILMDSSYDWNEKDDYRRRKLYSFITESFVEYNATWTFQHFCTGDESDCAGFLIIYGLAPYKYYPEPGQIDILVSTSATGNNIVDMSLYSSSTFVAVPFSIFAKVTQDRHPIHGLNVEATIQPLNPDGTLVSLSSSWVIKLEDDGTLTPDLEINDGIYSGVFIPDFDGFYKIHVTVQTSQHLSESLEESDKKYVSISKLLPVDQAIIGCSPSQNDCTSIKLDEPFRKVLDLQNPIVFINSLSYVKGTPFRITDLEVIPSSNYFITFSFTAPKLIGMEGGASQFNFYLSPRLKTLIGTGLGNNEIMINVGSSPGSRVSIRIPAMQEVTAYYTVEGLSGDDGELRSGSSNIIGIKTIA